MSGAHAPTHYELRVGGHLDAHWSAWFDGMTLVREDDGTTTVRGVVADQAALHGLLAKLRDIGAPIISVGSTAVGASGSTAEGEASDT